MTKIAVIGVPEGWSSELLAETVKQKTGACHLVDLEEVVLDLENETAYSRECVLTDMDALIIKKAGPQYSPHLLDRLEIIRFVQSKGVKVFSDPLSIMRVLDRSSCTIGLKIGGIPMPPTAITESVDQAVECVAKYKKCIFKPLYSTKARGMEVIEDGPDARVQIKNFKKDNQVMYLQQMVDIPGKDLGVAFMGGEYLATYARAGSKDSWNTTTRSGGKYVPYEPSQEIIDLAHKAQALFNLDFTCVDVVETKDGPMVFEVSAFGGFRGLLDANGINAADLYTNYVLEKCR